MLRSLSENIIAQTELDHQVRAQPKRRRWRQFIENWFNRLIFGVVMGLFFTEFFGLLLWRDPSFISEALGAANLIPAGFVVVWHFSLIFRTLIYSANSINREQKTGSWDMLILTGIDARRIVLGKWWGTVQHQWRRFLVLGVMRGALIAWIGAYVSRESVISYSFYYSSDRIVPPFSLNFIIVIFCAVLFTMANLLYTAAVGVLASTTARSAPIAVVSAIFSRVIILLIPFGSFACIFALVIGYMGSINGYISATLVALLDNGLTTLIQATQYHINYYESYFNPPFLMITSAALLLYTLLTWIVLRTATRSVVRQGALPPPLVPIPPSKSKQML